jgi:hypothetical protein
VKKMPPLRFCLECKNFEDRMEIDGNVVCARGHNPGISCQDFKDKFEGVRTTASKTRFCFECKNFEDRTEIDGNVVCARGHSPGISCPDFQDRVTDIFYNYLYWSYLYFTGKTSEGRRYFEEKFSRKLSNEELAYAVLAEYFNLRLDYMDFYRCWGLARKIYGQRMPRIAKILDAAVERFNLHGERTNLRRALSDMLHFKKSSEEIVREISVGLYKL